MLGVGGKKNKSGGNGEAVKKRGRKMEIKKVRSSQVCFLCVVNILVPLYYNPTKTYNLNLK